MCGIVGCKLKRPINPNDIKRMQNLRDQMSHRGPDGYGEYIEEQNGLYLGHRRLSILDLDQRSAQPMKLNDLVLTYNGEIYNYLELKKELEAELEFRTDSDTEVLLTAWNKWGKDCLFKMDGMFAFAMKDQEALHLVTDFFGEKPLYLYENDDGIYFASEAFPLIKTFNIEWQPNNQNIAQFLNIGYIEPPETGFRGLKSLPSGTHIKIDHNNNILENRYWTMPSPRNNSGVINQVQESDINRTRDLLCQSLEKRLRSDVDIGLFLSGGVDSVLVAALAKKELGVDLQTYTVAFPDGADETSYAAAIAKNLELEHCVIHSEEDTSWQKTPENLLTLYGIPNDNMTGLAVQNMCAKAKQYLTVAISGLGGDELFYGYNKYQTFYQNRHAYKLPSFLAPLLSLLPISKAKTASELLKGDSMRRFLRVKNGASQNLIEGSTKEPLANMLNDNIEGLTHKARYFDLISTMPQSYIPAIDRASMKESVEVRTPFLNRELLDFTFSLDQRALIDKEKKYVLRKLLSRYLDLDLLTPTKQGFVYPISRYFQQYSVNYKCSEKLIKDHERLALRQCILSELSERN